MYEAVGIGVSAGGIAALQAIIPRLRQDLPVAVVVVQHRLHKADDFLVDFLDKLSAISVKEALPGEPLQSGCVYIGPSGYHLLIERDKTFSLSVDPPVNYVIPSIDVLFESAALAYQEKFVGIILTGANNDGSKGLLTVKQYGGLTVVQDPSSAEVAIMPQSAIDTVQVDRILPLQEVETFLNGFAFPKET